METILAVVVFAFLIETIVEQLKPVLYQLEALEEKLGFHIAYVLSIVLGIAGAIYFKIDALSLFGIENAGLVGQVLTGLLASGGSNYVHNKLRHVSEIDVNADFIIGDDEEEDGKTR